MSRFATTLVVLCMAVTACASPGSTFVSGATAPAQRRFDGYNALQFVGRLRIEPFAIVFSRGKGEQMVRVSQRNWRGPYTVSNGCTGVSVIFQKYVDRGASLWTVGAHQRHDETCEIKFSGSPRHRGTNYLHISITR